MSWYLGIDPASVKVGLAVLHEHGDLDHAHALIGREPFQALHATGSDPGRRFAWIAAEVKRFIAPFRELGVACAVIENPKVYNAADTLMFSGGAIWLAVCEALPDTAVHMLKSAEVKMHALGDGSGKKADLMNGARLLGYKGADQDTADAICCADAARIISSKYTRTVA